MKVGGLVPVTVDIESTKWKRYAK